MDHPQHLSFYFMDVLASFWNAVSWVWRGGDGVENVIYTRFALGVLFLMFAVNGIRMFNAPDRVDKLEKRIKELEERQ